MMNGLFIAEVETQIYRDWERRFNKRVARLSHTTNMERPHLLRDLVENLKRAF